MAKINILPKEIFNLIAAGEVVERPSSVVKELVENSIDANATNITIEIQNGGISTIRVIDNGCGIESTEMKKVLMPHATSKIKTKNDLNKIGTLGFRGEALASISAVSNIQITSRTTNSNIATTIIKDENGEQIREDGAPVGTSVQVKELFKYIPARAKFLKKPKLEEAEVTNLVARYILANPKIAITYIADKKEIYKSTGISEEEALFAIYGKEAVQNTLYVDKIYNNIHIHGYIGKPSYSKPNRTYQTLVLNGRYIQNIAIQTAITNAYGDFLMKRQYPFYVIFIDMPIDQVDVNVHPNKMEVRFSNNINLYPIVFETVARALHENDYKPEASLPPKSNIEPIDNNTYLTENCTTAKTENNFTNYIDVINKIYRSDKVMDSKFNPNITNYVNQNKFSIDTTSGEVKVNETNEINMAQPISKQISFELSNEYKIIGSIFNTYMLVEQGEEILIIDQHAIHERILYDKLKKEIDSNNLSIQPMLIPYIFTTNSQESAFIDDHIKDFEDLGFEVAQLGENRYRLTSIPAVCNGISIGQFVSEILSDLINLRISKTSELIKENIATKACKAAVKGGAMLTNDQIKWLITTMQIDKTPLRCPHGRPAVIKVTKTEIEKWFKRIV